MELRKLLESHDTERFIRCVNKRNMRLEPCSPVVIFLLRQKLEFEEAKQSVGGCLVGVWEAAGSLQFVTGVQPERSRGHLLDTKPSKNYQKPPVGVEAENCIASADRTISLA